MISHVMPSSSLLVLITYKYVVRIGQKDQSILRCFSFSLAWFAYLGIVYVFNFLVYELSRLLNLNLGKLCIISTLLVVLLLFFFVRSLFLRSLFSRTVVPVCFGAISFNEFILGYAFSKIMDYETALCSAYKFFFNSILIAFQNNNTRIVFYIRQ